MAKSKTEEAWDPYVGAQGFPWTWVDDRIRPDRTGQACRVRAFSAGTKKRPARSAWVEFEDGESFIAPIDAVKGVSQ